MKIDLTKFRKKKNIAVIGDIMIDRYLNGIAERISPEAPIPVVEVKSVNHILGGAANVMSNAAKLGAKVWGFGVIGNDQEGKLIKKELAQIQVDSTNIAIEYERITTTKCRIMVGHHQMIRYDLETRQEISRDSEIKITDGLSQIADTIDMIVISDYDKGVMTPSLIKSVMSIARKHNLRVLVDPKVQNTRSYIGVNYLKVNLQNAEKVTGLSCSSKEDIAKMSVSLSTMLNCENIIVTLGKDGLLILSEGKISNISASAKDVYDVTGAGDVMTSILSIALTNGYDIWTACKLGTIGSAIKVSKVGTYSLSYNELMKAITEYNKGIAK